MSLYWNALTVHTNYLQYLWDNIYLNGNSTEACLRLHVKPNQLERVSSLILWNWIQECFIWKTDKVLIPDIEIHCSNSSKKMKKNVPCEVLLLILEDHHHSVGYNWLLRGRKFYFCTMCVVSVVKYFVVDWTATSEKTYLRGVFTSWSVDPLCAQLVRRNNLWVMAVVPRGHLY